MRTVSAFPVGWRVPLLVAAAVILLYLLAVDHGLAFLLVQGQTAFDQQFLHELVHDGRHVLGAPCH